jgi:hypothetical protein
MICFIPVGAYTIDIAGSIDVRASRFSLLLIADADEVTRKGLLLPEVSSCTELTAVSGTSDPF